MLRTIRALLLSALGTIALHYPSASVGQPYPDFREVEFFYTQDPQRFKSLWDAAQSRTIRIAVLGDSQETNPTSHGFQYMPLLNYEMWKRFGNSPETPLAGCFHYGPSPPANWLTAGRCTSPGPTATRLSSAQILPNARPMAFSTLNSSTNMTGGDQGQLTMLEQEAIHVHSSTGIPTTQAYFDTSGVVKARVFAATNATSGEVAYQARPNTAASPSYSAAVTTAGKFSLGLQSPTFAIKSGETTALDFAGKRYMALEVFGTSDTRLTDIIGLRFFNETRPEGVVIDSFSLGGYSAATFLRSHADAGPMFSVLGFHAAVIHYGANEGGAINADEFKANISAVISRVRTWVDDPAFPIILIADVYQSRLTPEQFTHYDQYVGAQLAIAQTDNNVMVINARRLMEGIGWNATSGKDEQYLEDGVHYTARGAQVLSAAVVSAMMGEVRLSECFSDSGALSLHSSMTLIVDVGGQAACTGYGQLKTAQSLTLRQPTLKVVLTNSFAPAAGDEFKLFSFASISGSFGDVILPTLPSGLSWNISELESTGIISVVPTAVVPPPLPSPPAISVTSGASQSVTLPGSPVPIGFSISGTSPLTVTTASSNTALLPNSGVTVNSGCGSATLSCAATLSAANGQTGSSTVSLTVTDAHGQIATTTAILEIKADSSSNAGPEPDSGSGTESDTATRRSGGGGSPDPLSLLILAALLFLPPLAEQRPHTRRANVTRLKGGITCDKQEEDSWPAPILEQPFLPNGRPKGRP